MIALITEKVHRTAAAVSGAVLLLCLRILSVDEAISYIDFGTIGVLVGMMLFVAVVRNSGLFEYMAIKSAKIAKGSPWKIMLLFMILTAVLSAFLDNVTTVLLVGPMAISIAGILGINPVPFLLTQILASNIGGTATLIGDPPNIMIGSKAGLSFADFVVTTGPAVILIMIVICALFYAVYGRRMVVAPERMAAVMELDEKRAVQDGMLMKKSLVMIALIVLGFVCHSSLGVESCVVALAAASIMLLIGRQDIEEIVLGVEWSTILFFTGLFVIVGGMVKCGVIERARQRARFRDRRQRHAADDPHSLGLRGVLVRSGQHPVRCDHDPADPVHAGGRHGCHLALVGAVARRVPRRQRHADRRVRERRSVRHFGQARSSDHLRPLSQGRLPDHGSVGRDFYRLSSCSFSLILAGGD